MVRALSVVDRLRETRDEGASRHSGIKLADRTGEVLPLLALCLYAIVILKTGWIADDAFASFRAASNLVNGYGLLSNPPERVQAFTNPLWTLLFAAGYSMVKSSYGVGMVLSVACSIATVALVALSGRIEVVPRLLAVLALSLSASFVDYSTSGLENPLSHLLLVCVYLCARRNRDALVVALVAALLALNRLDHLLLVLPLLAVRVVRAVRSRAWPELGRFALGFVPLALWHLFAVAYYGFPFPNTAVAKLNTTIPSAELWGQGLWYLIESFTRDPLTPLVMLAAVLAPLVTRNWRLVPFSLGILLYLVYVTRVGGDFMGGRFYSAPFVLAVVVLFHEVVPALPSRLDLGVGVLVVLVPVLGHSNPLVAPGPVSCPIPESGITNERDCYREHTGLVANVRIPKYKTHHYFKDGLALRKKNPGVHTENVVAMYAFAAGPKVHLVDGFGLTDPLLARIPFQPKDEKWRIGHFYRTLPDGYLESVRTGKNQLKNACLARYYDKLHRVTTGPLFSWARIKDIFWLNFRERTAAACL